MSLPRLTRALRAFAGVSQTCNDSVGSRDDLSGKCKYKAEKQLRDTLSWSQLTTLIRSGVSTEIETCSAKLQQLLNIAREIGVYFNFSTVCLFFLILL